MQNLPEIIWFLRPEISDKYKCSSCTEPAICFIGCCPVHGTRMCWSHLEEFSGASREQIQKIIDEVELVKESTKRAANFRNN